MKSRIQKNIRRATTVINSFFSRPIYVFLILTTVLLLGSIWQATFLTSLVGADSPLVNGGGLGFILIALLLVATSFFLLIDYRLHIHPLKQEDPSVSYSVMHHLKVVTLPQLRYYRRNLALVITTGTVSLLILAVGIGIPISRTTFAYAPDEFVTTWKTDNPGESASDQITIATNELAVYNYDVDWGDGTTSTGVTGDMTHTYPAPGTYEVIITGVFPQIQFSGSGDPDKILSVEQWGNNLWGSMQQAFMGCDNIVFNATDVPNLSIVTNMEAMFQDAPNFNSDISSWDVSNVQRFDRLFFNATSFNQPLNSWTTTSANDMHSMFQNASSFNQPIESWDVTGVTTEGGFGSMFDGASSFNQPLNAWDVSNAVTFGFMFQNASSFNQSLSSWVTTSATEMIGMFTGATSFNQPLNTWDVSNVTNIGFMFAGASSFNQPLDSWGTTSVVTMQGVFQGATSFNQPLNTWDVSNVTTFESMFSLGSIYDQPLDSWDTSAATLMTQMFYQNEAFDQPLNSFDVSGVTAMEGIFRESVYNQPLDSWNVSNVTNMQTAFADSLYNQPLNNWNVSSVTTMLSMFQNSQYNQPLNNWDVSSVMSMRSMFDGAEFNQPIESWDVSSVTTMQAMFASSQFNQPLAGWDMSSVTDINGMFRQSEYNQPLNSWDISSVTNLGEVFAFNTVFNQPLNAWDTSSVDNMAGLFAWASAFNQDLSLWDTSSVTDMGFLFYGATDFDYPLGSWDVSNVVSMQNILALGAGISTENYDETLQGWAIQILQPGLSVDMGTSTYCDASVQRQSIIDTFGWTITDGGEVNTCDDIDPFEPNEPPVVSITKPTNNASFAAGTTSVLLRAQAADPDGGVDEVRFYRGDTYIGKDTTAPYSLYAVNLSSRNYTFKAVAVDTSNERTTSDPVRITILAPDDSTPPTDPPIDEPGTTTPNNPTATPEAESEEEPEVAPQQEDYVPSESVATEPEIKGQFMIMGLGANILQNIPWILLFIVALGYMVQAYRQYRLNGLFERAIVLTTETESSVGNFLRIISHYLGTASTLLVTSVEMLNSEKTNNSKSDMGIIEAEVERLKKHVTQLLASAEKRVTEIKESASLNSTNEKLINRWVLVPLIGALLFYGIGVLGLSGIGILQSSMQVIVFATVMVIAGIAFVVISRKVWAHQEVVHTQLKQSQQAADATLQFRRELISQNQLELASRLAELEKQSTLITDTAIKKPFNAGLSMLRHVSAAFTNVYTLTSSVVGGAVDSSGMVAEYIQPYRGEAESKKVTLTTHIPPSIILQLLPAELKHLVTSIIDNAITFSDEGDTVDFILSQSKHICTLTVSDTGKGIAKDTLKTITQPFVRGTEAETYNYEGLGLNLYISRLIIEKYGGTLAIESEEGKGTTVTLKIPTP